MTNQPDHTNEHNGLVGELYSIAVNHQYYVRGGFFSDGKNNRHACLQEGWWCWKNALRHPQDIIKYLKRKTTHRKETKSK